MKCDMVIKKLKKLALGVKELLVKEFINDLIKFILYHHEQISPWSLETIQLGRNKLGPLYHMKEFLWVEISFKIPLPFTVLSFVQKFLKDIYYSWLKWAIMRVRTVACRELYFSVCKDFTYG